MNCLFINASPAFADWFPPALGGLVFTTLGLLKVYGFRRGIAGGGGKPWTQRARGSCPSWSWKNNVAMTVIFWIVGLGNFTMFAIHGFGK